MAPPRKRGGAKGAKANSQLNLGDLVLAKVKGFPAWPAKISKPEDWERAPDPKKYFVQFFGTEEIAFVAPVDIQPFTSESKNKLLARCKGKTVKYFSQAVREICDTFEELQNKSSDSLKDGNDGQSSQPDANSTEMVDDGMTTDGPSGETSFDDIVNHGPGLERCSHIHREMEYEDVKPSVSPIINDHSSLPVSNQKRYELCNEEVTSPKEESISTSGAGHNTVSKSGLKVETNGQKSKKIAKASKKNPDGDHGINKIHSPAGVSSLVQTSHHESTITENLKDGIRSSLHGSKNEVTEGVVNPEIGGHVKKAKTLLKDKTHVAVADDLSKDVEGDSTGRNNVELTARKMKTEYGHGKDNVLNNGVLHPTKRSKCLDDVPNRSQTYRKNDVSVKGGNEEVKKLTPSLKTKNRLASKGQTNALDSGGVGEEDVLPPTKRRRRAPEAMSGSTKMSEDRIAESSIPSRKGENFDAVKSNTRGPLKRRAVRICDDDEEEPKTPVHGASAKGVGVSQISVSVDEGASVTEAIQDSPGLRNSIVHAKKVLMSSDQHPLPSSPNSRQDIVEIVERQFSHSPGKAESEKKTCEEVLKVLVSPIKSPVMGDAYNSMVEPLKANKSLGKVSGNVSQRKGQAGSFKASSGNYDGGHRSQNIAANERSRPAISGEKQKSTPKSSSRVTDSSAALRKSGDRNLFPTERLDLVRVDRTLSADSRSADSNKSMKHLIAVAQAKRKQAQSQNLVHDSLNISHATTTDAIVRSPGSISAVQPILAVSGIMVQTDGQGYRSQSSLASPSRAHQFISNDQPDTVEAEETRTSSGHRIAGGSLSGGTEAAVARDAFEGMIETLSRTKESIGRATRHAIDCAKHGIANEVVELLTRKLETESSFHRRVDLFFLVDSITQCSHSQKGIAGASYIPAVQTALPRLLGAAAPPGANARENRRQCLKVLKLWLERKILPDTLLRSYIEDIGASNDDASGGFFSKRPSRSERAVDDPIREMEGMLVDEYGSNATFQMPGFLSSNVFEEEEDDILNFSHKEGLGKSTLDVSTVTGELETCSATPNDKRHRILEDVDGELEMEDVSGHPKDEKLFTGGSFKAVEQEESSDRLMDSASNNSNEASPFREGSPPLPLDSPPLTPPLPSSPPPPLSPMVPPPPSSPSPPSPPPPPPPPQPPSQTYHLHPSIVVPSQVSFPQPSLLSQSSLPPQSSMPPQTSTTGQHAYQSPMPSIVPLNTRLVAHVDAAVRGEMFPQQPSSFVSAVVSSSREPSGYNSLRTVEYGHETYTNSQSSQSNQLFQTGNVPLPPRAFQPPMLPQTGAGQFQYPNPAMLQHPYPPLYGLTKHADGLRRYGADEQWRPPSNEFSADNQRGAWISNSRPPLSSGPPFAQEGYFRPPMERPLANNVGIQPTGQNKVPAGASIPGHSGSMMMPCRPDLSSLNSWRPA